MEENFKVDGHEECNKCNVYITVNCDKEDKDPCHDREQGYYKNGDKYYPERRKHECRECNVFITVNCEKDEKKPCYCGDNMEQGYYKISEDCYPGKDKCRKCNVYITVNCDKDDKDNRPQ